MRMDTTNVDGCHKKEQGVSANKNALGSQWWQQPGSNGNYILSIRGRLAKNPRFGPQKQPYMRMDAGESC